jgi:hypothetical protein
MIFSDLPLPEASNETTNRCLGFAQAGNQFSTFPDHALGLFLRPNAGNEFLGFRQNPANDDADARRIRMQPI